MAQIQDPNDLPVSQSELLKLKAEDTKNFRKVKLLSFQAEPTNVTSFGNSTISWKVSLPDVLALKLSTSAGSQYVSPEGSTDINLLFTTKYTLIVYGEVLSKEIGSLTITVDETNIAIYRLEASLIEGGIKNLILNLFPKDQIGLRDESAKLLSIDYTGIHLTLPLVVYVNNWRNADLDISLTFSAYAFHQDNESRAVVRMNAVKTSVDVSWTIGEHILANLFSKGCSTVVQYVSQTLVKGFINGALKPYLERDFEDTLQTVANTFLRGFNPDYRLLRITMGDEEISIVGAPR